MPAHHDGSGGVHGHTTMKSLFQFSSYGAWASSKLRNRVGKGILSRRSTWPKWLLRAMQIIAFIRGDDQRVGR